MMFHLRPGIRRLFRLPLRTPAAIHDDVDAELEAVFAARVDSLIARGLSPADARAEALSRLGTSVDDVRHQLHQSAELRERRMRFREQLESVAQDIRYAARGLMRRPVFTAVAVLTLAIGIGATTAIFSAVNALLLRRLPYAAPNQLMTVSLTTPANGAQKGLDDMVWSYPKYAMFRDAQTIFSDLSLYSLQPFSVTSGDVELIKGEFVGARYLRTLGLVPARGRDFDPGIDAHPGAPRQAILSYAFWERRYNADPGVVGKTVDLDRNPYTIIGVAPADFRGLTGLAEIFVPITTRAADDLGEAQSYEFYMVARRRPGVGAAAAAAAVRVLGARIHVAIRDQQIGDAKWGANARPLDDLRVSPLIRRSLLVVFGAVAFVLLIACLNVANLLLGRATQRRREIAVRLAIGAGRRRLVRLLLTESVLLAAVGGLAGVAVAWAGVHALDAINPDTMLRGRPGALGAAAFSGVHLDRVALAFTFTVTLVVGFAFGLAPAFQATRASLAGAMKDAAGEGVRHASGRRGMLVVTEVALAVILLAGSGLMIRSLTKLLAIDTGFDAQHVLTLRLTIPAEGLARDSMPGFYTELLDRLRALPGVSNAGLNNCPPLNGGCNGTKIEFLDRPKVDWRQMPIVGVHWATPSWFATLHIPLKRGRVFGSEDRAGTPKVVLINETAARTFWPNESPLGKRVGIGQGGFADGAEVIGIIGDVRQFVDSLPKPDVYLPYAQSPSSRMMIFIRTSGDPVALVADVRRAIHDVAPRYPVYDIQTMTERAAGATAQTRFNAVLLGLFAATALALAVVGIYGVMSLAVTSRTREIGIRIALGADQHRVRRLVVGEGVVLVSVGAVIGLAGALACTRVLQGLLFDLKPSDPLTYATIVAVLGVAGVAASWIPARRASRVDPVVALRAE